MIITDQKLNELADIDGISFEQHERVPFVLVTPESIITVNEVEQVIVDNYYTETHDGLIYAKIGSTHRNNDNTFSGAEPTWNAQTQDGMEKMWLEQVGPLISANTMMEIRKVGAMTLEEYQAYMVEELRTQKDDVNFKDVIVSDAKGEDLNYTINLVKSIEIKSMIDDAIKNGSDVIATHDDSKTRHEAYTLAEAEILYKDIKTGIATRAAYYDIFITRASNMAEKLTVEQLTDLTLTEEEQGYVNQIVYEI